MYTNLIITTRHNTVVTVTTNYLVVFKIHSELEMFLVSEFKADELC